MTNGKSNLDGRRWAFAHDENKDALSIPKGQTVRCTTLVIANHVLSTVEWVSCHVH